MVNLYAWKIHFVTFLNCAIFGGWIKAITTLKVVTCRTNGKNNKIDFCIYGQFGMQELQTNKCKIFHSIVIYLLLRMETDDAFCNFSNLNLGNLRCNYYTEKIK